MAVLGIAAGVWVAVPLPADLLAPAEGQSLLIQSRDGQLLRNTRADDGSLARWVRLEEIDPDLSRAFVAVEDRRFYQHRGIDPRAVGRALRDNIAGRRVVSGASTITMQLARLLSPIGHGPVDKLAQALWALRLEAHLSKAEILENYLNRVPLGQGAVGVAAAVRLYFGTSPGEVSLGQAALLAALARSPSGHNPMVSPSRAARRREIGLAALRREGYAGLDEVRRARGEPLTGVVARRPFLAPHFTSRLLATAEADRWPLRGTWRTSLDLSLQEMLEGEVRHTISQLRDRGVEHAAAVVLENQSGEILAWVGSPDFWADTAGQVDMVTGTRQPGSALKPFLYALAFDRGITAATVLADIAVTYQTAGGPYHPRNYDRRYHGPVRAREALASSFNVPAVGLADRLGVGTLLNGLQRAGFVSLRRSPEFYGLGLALGNGDVSLLELANGYRALANGGRWSPVRWLASAEPPSSDAHQVVSERAAYLTLDILADPEARAPGFGLRTPFDWPFRVAVKTGTSRHFTDNWAVAATAGFTVAVWVGNFNGRPMEGVSGITGAGPLLHRAVLMTARRVPPGDLPRPQDHGLAPHLVCRVSGMRPGPYCPTLPEYFVPGTEPERACDWHTPDGVVFPPAYAEWVAVGAPVQPVAGQLPRVPAPAGGHTFAITSPADGDHYRVPPGVEGRYATIALRAAGSPHPVRWYVDDQPVGHPRWPLLPGRHRIRATTGTSSDEVTITVE
jgi:penicillin-binding protein 1C